ncbi:hypothetical protein HU200_014373 [Digitaria exilis]|uniref:Uncharacterized protein n=1 Tax=Digitaria exilis TaxID=1010633 RepID=A0A835FBK9_9POAL|nr:hypothetical protein HU200_014373 [Digitaria exilis]
MGPTLSPSSVAVLSTAGYDDDYYHYEDDDFEFTPLLLKPRRRWSRARTERPRTTDQVAAGNDRPASATTTARASTSGRRGSGDDAGEPEGAVARHGVWVRACSGGHGHGRDQEAPQLAAAGAGRERAVLLRRRRGVGAVEADPVAELQGRRGRGGRRGAGEAGVGTYKVDTAGRRCG